jgi:hypothetical protein
MARADARAARLAPVVAELRCVRITSWYGIAQTLSKRGVLTPTGRGIWEPAQVGRVMERLKWSQRPANSQAVSTCSELDKFQGLQS